MTILRRATTLAVASLLTVAAGCSGVDVAETASAGSTATPTSVAATSVAPTDPVTTDPVTSTTRSTTGDDAVAVIVEPGQPAEPFLEIRLAFESRVADVSTDELRSASLAILGDDRGWMGAGFTFVADPASTLRVVLAEGSEVDALCLPLQTGGTVSCQNGPVVALNATRWREATDSWDSTLEEYRTYLVNHEVGHLVGQRHPVPRCPIPGAPAAVMEQQTSGLEGCTGNGWPRAWEIAYAADRPAMIGPDPSWQPEPRPVNVGG